MTIIQAAVTACAVTVLHITRADISSEIAKEYYEGFIGVSDGLELWSYNWFAGYGGAAYATFGDKT